MPQDTEVAASEISSSSKQRQPRWHIVYFALAAFDILAIGVSLTLNHQMMAVYEDSVEVNLQWAERLRTLTVLNGLALQTNAPGNDVFDTLAVADERAERNAYLQKFHAQSQLIRGELANNVSGSEADRLFGTLDEIDAAMNGMVVHADMIFDFFDDGQAEKAGRMMATMDRSYGELTTAIGSAIDTVQNIQAEHFDEQIQAARTLKQFEYLIGGLIVIMVLAVAIYGHKIGRAMKDFQEKIQKSHDRAQASARDLATKNSELEDAKKRLEYNARHDFLSDLPNRRYLDEYLSKRIADPAVEAKQLALLHIDLDQFKQVNDVFGHEAGDMVIVHAAKLLRSSTSPGDFIARVGGDEFVVVTSCNGASEGPTFLADRIIEGFREPILFGENELRVGASVGISFQETACTSGHTLMVQADIALYRAKHLGRNRFEIFSAELHDQILNKKRLSDDIRIAIETESFEPHYQIQVDSSTMEVVGIEALARMNHPSEGLKSPAFFMPTADEMGVVDEIDRIILEKALEDLHVWKTLGLPIPRVSVNVSARRLVNSNLIDFCRKADIRKGELSFELVETIFLDEPEEEVVRRIEELRALGIGIEIDDFGSGHASILSVLRISPSRLKIDRGLTSRLADTPAQANLIRSIVEFGISMDIQVVAEGVESFEQADTLKKLGCGILQGFLFSRPVPASDIPKLVGQEAWKQAS